MAEQCDRVAGIVYYGSLSGSSGTFGIRDTIIGCNNLSKVPKAMVALFPDFNRRWTNAGPLEAYNFAWNFGHIMEC